MEKFYQTTAYKAYKAKNIFHSKPIRIISFLVYLILIGSLICLGGKYFDFLQINIPKEINILIAGCLLWMMIDIFVLFGYGQKNKDLKNAQEDQIPSYFSDEVTELFDQANTLCKKYQIQGFNFSSLVFALAHIHIGRYFLARTKIFIDKDLEKQSMLKIAQQNINEAQIKEKNNKFLLACKERACSVGHEKITFSDVIISLYETNVFFSHLLSELVIEREDLNLILNWTENIFLDLQPKYFWQKDYYADGIGADWAYGYTPLLNVYSSDITAQTIERAQIYECKARLNIINEMEQILSKSGKNNILLIGDPGVGKENIVEAFAQKIYQDANYRELEHKRIINLDVARILAGATGANEIQTRFMAIFAEIIKAGNIVVYIENFASLINANMNQVGVVDISQLLIPYLESERMQIIVGISYDDFKNKLQANSNVESMFTKIEVKELAKDEVLPSIEQLINYIESRHQVMFTYQSLKHLIELCDRYVHDKPFPQKTIDFITELAIQAEKQNDKIIDIDNVDKIISERIKIPTGEIQGKEKDKLLNLEQLMHERVIGQEEAISVVANALRRARAGLTSNKRPIGSFLFIGPTGVGKTETAKALAAIYYGSEKNMIRFDMSEFQSVNAIGQLIGTKNGNEVIPGRLTQGVRNNPYTLILFDELEKAHANVLNLFLQILDDGRLTDVTGRTIDFTNTIIIATSNAGSEKIRQYLNDNLSSDKLGKIITDYLLEQNIFRPEFINRFDKIVCFKPLTLEEIMQIVKLMIENVNATLIEKNISLNVTPEAIKKIANTGYDPVFGARPLRRLIQEKIENKIAKELITGQIGRGQTIEIKENDL